MRGGPSGYEATPANDDVRARVAADDGTLAAFATNGSRDAGGVPVVWRLRP